jgi:hypothetical protein
MSETSLGLLNELLNDLTTKIGQLDEKNEPALLRRGDRLGGSRLARI